MNIKKLKEIIKDLPDDTPVLTPGPDHSYNDVSVYKGTGLRKDGNWTEDHGERLTPESVYGKRLPILVIA